MAKIIAVANQKGGVGKTTTCVNLAAALHLCGKRVLLCDMDPQGHASIGLGYQKKEDVATIYNVLVGQCGVAEAIRHTAYGDLLPANTNLVGCEVEMLGMDNRHYLLRDILAKIKHLYDFVIVDCPPSLGQLTINALCAADSVIVPIDCGFYALEGLSSLTTTISMLKKELNPSLCIEGVLLTMFDSRTNLAIQIAQEIKRFFPRQVFHTVIPRNVRLAEAPSHSKPVLAYDRYSKGCASYMKLAEEIIQKNLPEGAKA